MYLARKTGVSPYLYNSLGAVGILVTVVVAIKYVLGRKRM
jgi:hypothetical protein